MKGIYVRLVSLHFVNSLNRAVVRNLCKVGFLTFRELPKSCSKCLFISNSIEDFK